MCLDGKNSMMTMTLLPLLLDFHGVSEGNPKMGFTNSCVWF